MKEQKNISIKKIILVLTVIPYVFFGVVGLINLIKCSIEHKYLDLYAFIEPLYHFWIESVLNNPGLILLAIFLLAYPMCYFIGKVSSKRNQNIDSKDKISKLFIIYLLSFIPYLYIVKSCIFGMEFGLFGNTSIEYGFHAFTIICLLSCFVPIYPILFVFQVIYTIRNRKNFNKKTKIIMGGIVIGLILAVVIPSIIYTENEKVKQAKVESKDKIVIEKYLTDEFGEKHYKDMEIRKYNSGWYTVYTPLLNNDAFELYLNDLRNDVSKNTFYERFTKQHNMNNKLAEYLSGKYNLSNNVKLDVQITKIDIKDYNKSQELYSLLDKCEYTARKIYIYDSTYSEEKIIETIKDLYTNHKNMMEKFNISNIYVKINDKYYASILIHKSNNQSNQIKLDFSGYTYSSNPTIKSESITVNLSN